MQKATDRKLLGAYYTSGDVARFMAASAIVPRLLVVNSAAAPSLWQLLRSRPDRYIRAPVQYGVNLPLPREIEQGVEDVSRRGRWNDFATADLALPGESWRECVSRRGHYALVQRSLTTSRSRSIAALLEAVLTLNLDFQQLALDAISACDDPGQLLELYYQLRGGPKQPPLSILDPTCGDGAFLLAALEVLRPIYDRCLRKMLRLAATTSPNVQRKLRPIVDNFAQAANRRRHVDELILTKNLFGVDLNPNAVTACQTRLIDAVESRGVPTLPRSSINIRRGNALTLDWAEAFPAAMGNGGFDVVLGNPPFFEYKPLRAGYRLPDGLRTVRCGNLHAFVTERATTLLGENGAFSFIVPAASCATPRMAPQLELLKERFESLWISLYDERPSKLFAGVDQQLAIIVGHGRGPCRSLAVTPMRHWSVRSYNERPHLLAATVYQPIPTDLSVADVLPKTGSPLELEMLEKLAGIESIDWRAEQDEADASTVYYRNAGGRYWRLVKSFPTPYRSQRGGRSTSTEIAIRVRRPLVPLVVCLFSSSLFYWYWRVVSNCRHLTQREVVAFPVAASLAEASPLCELDRLRKRFERRLKQTSRQKTTNNAQSGRIAQHEYRVAAAKPILDDIDRLLAAHYGLNEEELDFVINYDIKYRLPQQTNPTKSGRVTRVGPKQFAE